MKIVIEESRGVWHVTEERGDSRFPTLTYDAPYAAAARVLQLMDISSPVAPQDWPETVCVGEVNGKPVR